MIFNKNEIPLPEVASQISQEVFPGALIVAGLQSLWRLPSYGLQITTTNASILLGISKGPKMQIVSLRVNEQKVGIGKSTVVDVERIASDLGIKEITVLNGKDTAGFWEKCGYEQTIWRHNFNKKIQP